MLSYAKKIHGSFAKIIKCKVYVFKPLNISCLT